MNRKLVLFNGIWCRLNAVYASGRSDDQLMDEAHKMYKSETKQSFNLVYLWKVIHKKAKWTRYYGEAEKGNDNDASQRGIEGEIRPPGTKQAKAKLKATAESSSVTI